MIKAAGTFMAGVLLFAGSLQAQVKPRDIDMALVRVNDTLFAGKFEVTNRLYTEFLNSLDEKDRRSYDIDSLRWRDKLAYNEPYVRYYHQHPAYADYPVVNVSVDGAAAFCQWLTTTYTASGKGKFKNVRFRLPTEKEWEMAARGTDAKAVYAWKGSSLVNEKGEQMANRKRADGDQMGVAGRLNDNADITAPVKSYWPNSIGAYNFCGNVAEMVADKPVVKGGSWIHKDEFIRIDNKVPYDGKPTTWVGFRYVMVVRR